MRVRNLIAVLEGEGPPFFERVAIAWVGPAGFAALKELALAEHQATRRRIRLDCER